MSAALLGAALLGAPPAAADTATPSGGGTVTSTTPGTTLGTFDAANLSSGLPTPSVDVDVPDGIEAGTPVDVLVRLSGPSTADEILVLEKRREPKDGNDPVSWVSVSSTALADDGRGAFLIAEAEAGSSTYRVRLSATTEHRAVVQQFALEVSPAALVAPPREQLPPSRPLCGGDVRLRPDGTPWVCTYDDEFDGSDLDRRYWVPQTTKGSGFVSGTATQPACAADDPRTIGVHDGGLELSAVVLDAPLDCGKFASPYVSGSVTHHGTFSQTYGRYEVRAKLPDHAGKGLQETLWLWPNDPFMYGTKHPASGEMDFGEFYSNYPDLTIPVMHYLFYPQTVNLATNANVYTSYVCKIQTGTFNTYAFEWEPGKLTVLVNDRVCLVDQYTAMNAPTDHPFAPFDAPFFLSLSQLFGTTGNEFDPATGPRRASTTIDYVHIWS